MASETANPDMQFFSRGQPKRLRTYFHPRNIHATRVVTLSAAELGIMYKNNLRGITMGIYKGLNKEAIARRLQLPHIPVTAVSQTDLFLV